MFINLPNRLISNTRYQNMKVKTLHCYVFSKAGGKGLSPKDFHIF